MFWTYRTPMPERHKQRNGNETGIESEEKASLKLLHSHLTLPTSYFQDRGGICER